ncbi:MAG: hypothetical protein U1C58_06335 [Flavobacteriaceae bacterium]|nr:hypothetical protein [Flavobacteriaceae bacterium]
MNIIDIQQTGGFPLETDTIDRLQTNVLLMQAFGEAFGNFGIVKGANIVGTTVSDGVVYINGELLEFRGAQLGTNVIIVEEVENRVFEDGTNKSVFKTRYATFGTATTSYPWANFVRPKNLIDLSKMQRIVGEIIDWFGNPAAVPNGWKICDGTNGTPDLRGRMTMGYDPGDPDYDTVGKIGGAKQVTLTEAEIPAHNHAASSTAAGAHTHNIALKGGESDGGNSGRELRQNTELGIPKTVTTDSQGSHTHSIAVSDAGGGGAHENRPPYMAMLKLMWVG